MPPRSVRVWSLLHDVGAFCVGSISACEVIAETQTEWPSPSIAQQRALPLDVTVAAGKVHIGGNAGGARREPRPWHCRTRISSLHATRSVGRVLECTRRVGPVGRRTRGRVYAHDSSGLGQLSRQNHKLAGQRLVEAQVASAACVRVPMLGLVLRHPTLDGNGASGNAHDAVAHDAAHLRMVVPWRRSLPCACEAYGQVGRRALGRSRGPSVGWSRRAGGVARIMRTLAGCGSIVVTVASEHGNTVRRGMVHQKTGP